ncbi:MAG: ABC transporter substrate-binding protein [candidate division NC10 bacterium]|nr:ABC transporter substrate-binding protein [candidate division NC10 bacterium]
MRCRARGGLGRLLLAVTLALEAIGAPAAAEAKKVKIAQAAESLLYLPAYVASVQGYFKEEGLEVTQIPTGGGGAEVQALLAGKVDFAMAGGAAQLSAMQKGAKLLAVANIGDKLAVNFAIHKEAARARGITEQTPFVEKLKAIKGLTFGATGPGTITWQVGEYFVSRAGYTLQKEVQMIASGAGPVLLAALEQRKIDVLIETVPVPETAVDRGTAIMLFNLAKGEDPEIGEFMLGNLLVRPESARRERDTVRRMVRALLKGSRFVTERSPEETAEVIQKTPLGKFPKGVLLAGVASVKGAFPPHGRMSQRALDVTQKLMREAGQLQRTFTLLEIYSPEFLP